jgi:integrase
METDGCTSAETWASDSVGSPCYDKRARRRVLTGISGERTDPDRGKVLLGDYARTRIKERPGLRPKTVELYTWLLERHIVPGLGGVAVGKLTTQMIRSWRTKLIDNGVSVSTAAKAYRPLRAVLMTAVEEDKLLSRNPCRIKGADNEQTPERPILTVAQVFELADKMADRRSRALILLATFAGLRWGEVIALRRSDIDIEARTVRVLAPPKSRAGKHPVSIPLMARRSAGDLSFLSALPDECP